LSFRDGNAEIYVMDADGGHLRRRSMTLFVAGLARVTEKVFRRGALALRSAVGWAVCLLC
jgi:hypothetical protein